MDDAKRLVETFGVVFDSVKTEVETVLDIFRVRDIPIDDIPLMDHGLGWPTNPDLHGDIRRRETLHAVERFKTKGCFDTAEAFFETLADWTVNLHAGWLRILLSNDPRSRTFKDGTQVWNLEITSVLAAQLYSFTVELDGLVTTVSYTSSGAPTAEEIRDGLIAAIGAAPVTIWAFGDDIRLRETQASLHVLVATTDAKLTLSVFRARVDVGGDRSTQNDPLFYMPSQDSWHCLNGALLEIIPDAAPATPSQMITLGPPKMMRFVDYLLASWAVITVYLNEQPLAETVSLPTEAVV